MSASFSVLLTMDLSYAVTTKQACINQTTLDYQARVQVQLMHVCVYLEEYDRVTLVGTCSSET